jgi:predicted nucleic acid-binding protein
VGLTLIDAGVLIGLLDGNDAHHLAAIDQMQAARHRGDRLSIPASAFAESLVSPSRAGDGAVRSVTDFADRLPLTVQALDQQTAVVAAGLRARHGRSLRLPDALVVATAIRHDAEVLVTTDRGWPEPADLTYEGRLIVL